MIIRSADYLYIAATIFFTVYGQLVLKWRIGRYGSLPQPNNEKVVFLLKLLFDPFILSGFVAAFLAALAWMAAMTKFDISYAYPFMALNFVLVFIFGAWFLSEPLSISKSLGVFLIIGGVVIVARG